MDTERLLKVVERTASHGLAQPDSAKWMLIWCCDICGELAEYIEEPSLEEAGDVLWGCGAISLITGVPLPKWIAPLPISPLVALCGALKLLDHLKKVARDGLEHREVNEQLVRTTFATVLGYLMTQVDLDEAVSAVEVKLLKRYPDGYSADKSVNRVI